jgi:hypothetical protein
MNWRELLSYAGAAFAAPTTVRAQVTTQRASGPSDDRAFWVDTLRRLADPVLENLANETLRARMPVEQAPGADRRSVTHLEALGRLIAGIAPWVELAGDSTAEGQLRTQYAALARRAIDRAVEPSSPDYLNFTRDQQPLVDAAFLGQGVIRARRALRDSLEPRTVHNLILALESTRAIPPVFNNWLLFSAMIEATLATLGARWDRMRVDYALRQHEQWYKGDGMYGDGPSFHWDYYNSFVIQPMMLDVLDVCRDEMPAWKNMTSRVEERARRYTAILERLVAPDGSFPAVGRSLAYRFGAFHLLAQMALRHALPDGLSPAQVRSALTAVIRRSMNEPLTFDSDGWLRIGFCGHQPGVGEPYISTGSLYLCAVGLLPLGLAPTDEFWAAPAEPWTSVRAWSGQGFAIDRGLPT